MPSQKNIRERDFMEEPNTKKCRFCGKEYQVFGPDEGFCCRAHYAEFFKKKEIRDFESKIIK